MKKTFGDKIKELLKDNGYSYRVRVFPKKEGVINRAGKKVFQDYEKVVIYAGRNIEKIAQKRSMRLVAWKENGKWQGDMDVVEMQGGKGDRIFIRDYHDTTEPLKYVMYSDCDWDDDEEYAKNKLLKIMENWKVEIGNNAYRDGRNDYAGKTGTIYYCNCNACRVYRIKFDTMANSEKLKNFIRKKIILIPPK